MSALVNTLPPAEDGRKPTWSRTPPPGSGVPFGYVLEVTTLHCGGCGNATKTSRLIAVEAAGYGSKALTLGASSRVFDREVKRIDRTAGTPRCLDCIDTLPRLPVDYPAPGRAMHTYTAPRPTAKGGNGQRPAVTPDLDSDFM